MGEKGREIDDPGGLVDRGGLHGCDLLLAQRLADDLKPARERRIPELPCTALPALRLDRADADFSGLVSSICSGG